MTADNSGTEAGDTLCAGELMVESRRQKGRRVTSLGPAGAAIGKKYQERQKQFAPGAKGRRDGFNAV